MKKRLLINELIENVCDLNELGKGRSASLLIYGDAESMTSLTNQKGNPQILATAFGNQMDHNPEFNSLMKSLMGAYLINNPDQKEEFVKVINGGFEINMN